MERNAKKTVILVRSKHKIFFLVFMVFACCSVEGHASFTIKEKFLLGYQIEEDFQTDWLGCLLKCQQHSECVSYNFHRGNNLCQLNSHGIENTCMAERVLHSGTAYVFHQIKVCSTSLLKLPLSIISLQLTRYFIKHS